MTKSQDLERISQIKVRFEGVIATLLDQWVALGLQFGDAVLAAVELGRQPSAPRLPPAGKGEFQRELCRY